MTRNIVILLLVSSLISCQFENTAKFEISNLTDLNIDSINIKSSELEPTEFYLNLKPGEKTLYNFDMSDLPKVDGDYLLSYKIDNGIKQYERFGYFTNGYPLEEITKIYIKKDTVIIDQVFKENYY